MLREVLLVDDSDSDNFFHERVIRKSGLCERVTAMTSVDNAIEFLRNRSSSDPSLILLDINMPGKDGWVFLREFSELPREHRESLVVVMLTSSSHELDRANAREFDVVHDYVVKPLKLEALQQLVARCFPS